MTDRFNWTWTEKQHKRWAAIRAKGRWQFIVYRGIIGWGCTMFLVLSVGPVVFGFPHRAVGTPFYWAWNAALWLVAGIVWAVATWAWSEKYYARVEGWSGDVDQRPSNDS